MQILDILQYLEDNEKTKGVDVEERNEAGEKMVNIMHWVFPESIEELEKEEYERSEVEQEESEEDGDEE